MTLENKSVSNHKLGLTSHLYLKDHTEDSGTEFDFSGQEH